MMFEWTTETPLSTGNFNEAQQKIVDVIYPIGSIYKSTNNVNPSEILGGTWEETTSRDLIEKGTSNGIEYFKYSDGYCEMQGSATIDEVEAISLGSAEIELPFSIVSNMKLSLSMTGGGSGWADAGYQITKNSNQKIAINVWNSSSGKIASTMYDWRATGYIQDPTLFAWKRVA